MRHLFSSASSCQYPENLELQDLLEFLEIIADIRYNSGGYLLLSLSAISESV